MRAVFGLYASMESIGAGWIAPSPAWRGVMSIDGNVGGPSNVLNVPWALIVVPCGIDPIRTRVTRSWGSVVAGTVIQSPGSKWIPIGSPVVTSSIDCA